MRTPVIARDGALRPLGLDEVAITGGFWAQRDPRTVIDHCLHWLDKEGWIDNFRTFAGRGREFADSEVYKTMEAMAWVGDERLPGLAAVVSSAQASDGYLQTRAGRPGQPSRYSDLEWGHELYCLGHLIQAGVARLRSGQKDELTATAIRAADHVVGQKAYCGHPEVEMALVELYRCTGSERYLAQAKSFVDRRGQGLLSEVEFGRAYFQDDEPVRRRRVLSGHAVRALYLACGAIDVAVETGDRELLEAIVAQHELTVQRRTYLTGGMGSRRRDEAFGEDFELSPDGAYAETCAGVASVMLAWRLLLATGEARYADLIERTLFNVVAASPAPDCRSFFYANPLQWSAGMGEGFEVAGQRAPWFEVSCCPTNLARTLASLPAYLATTNGGGIQIHQYATAKIAHGEIRVEVETGYPWSGDVRVRVVASPPRPWTLSLRVPPWAGRGGYVSLGQQWRPGDEVMLRLPMRMRWTEADPRVEAIRGCVAAERGPLVYCMETGRSGERLIPYYLWANNGPSTMRVWLPLTTGPEVLNP